MTKQKAFILRIRRNRNSSRWSYKAPLQIVGKTPQTFVIFHSIQRSEASSRATAYVFWCLARITRSSNELAMNESFPFNTNCTKVRATTSANTDRTQKRIQDAGIAGLEKIPLVKNYVAE